MNKKIETIDQFPTCDALQIGFDCSKKNDVACLTVSTKNSKGMAVISVFHGEEALWLYARLVNGPTRHPSYMRSDMFQSPLYMTTPKGLGLSEAKENFKEYMNAMYGAPNANSFEAFKKSFPGCEIVSTIPDIDGNIEIRFNFGREQNFLHLAYRVTERQRVNTAPAKMEEDLCRRAIEDLERSKR